MKFTRSINQHGWKNAGQPGYRPMYKYASSDDLFTAELFQIWHPMDKWEFVVKLNLDIKKELFNSIVNRATCKTLKEAKKMAENIIGLLHLANDNNEFWIAKGVMLGFTDISQMQHLKNKL